VRGTKIKISKLNEDKVRIIRLRLSSGEQVKSIAKDFGVNESTIRGIRDKVLWKHILES
jgi:transposase-like protein